MGDVHAQHSMADCLRAADTMEKMLAVVEAARNLPWGQGNDYWVPLIDALVGLKESE